MHSRECSSTMKGINFSLTSSTVVKISVERRNFNLSCTEREEISALLERLATVL